MEPKIPPTEASGCGTPLLPRRQAMIDHGAIQCGYCTPAMVLNGVALFAADPHPDERALQTAIAATTCRCTGYNAIRNAFRAVAAGGEAG